MTAPVPLAVMTLLLTMMAARGAAASQAVVVAAGGGGAGSETPPPAVPRTQLAGPRGGDDDYDYDEEYLEEEQPVTGTASGLGQYLGAPCVDDCSPSLPHTFCDPVTQVCECEKHYPVKLGATKGCAKPVRLGEQCYYLATCTYTDAHAECKQIAHNAICQCKPGYHVVARQRPTKKVFCSEDLVLLTTDMPTLFGVATGLAIFTALICFVLKLFSRARYSRPRHYANANLAPPILFSSETGIPLAVHGARPPSRASSQRSAGTAGSSTGGCGFAPPRRASSDGLVSLAGTARACASRGVAVPASRAGAARAAAILLISCHLTATAAKAAAAEEDSEAEAPPPLAGPAPTPTPVTSGAPAALPDPGLDLLDADSEDEPPLQQREPGLKFPRPAIPQFRRTRDPQRPLFQAPLQLEAALAPVKAVAAGFSLPPRLTGFQYHFGSRRPSLASIHSSASSSRSMSFSMRKFERENQQREERRLQLLAQQQEQQQLQQQQLLEIQQKQQQQQLQLRQEPQQAAQAHQQAPSPSPRTPMSTDELLPAVSEEALYNSGSSSASSSHVQSAYQGPCTSTEASR
ncbi:AF4/FMR2 family member lilli [Schistocerca americana]|uniref:AF4/FMR2 family member lilli n=1 Tax=Schistocerca americana TaxID=7009 RepID=UPI001F4FA46E|nr:AF4/FMR2 family member lilli [Schistocerca americana]